MSRLRLALLGLISLVFAAGCTGAPIASAWPGLAANAELAFVANNNRVVAVNLSDGKQRWSFPATPGNGDQFFADPGVSADVIVVGSEGPLSSHSGALFGLDPATGAQLWCLGFDEKAAARLGCPLTPSATKSIVFGLMPPVDNRILGGVTVKDGGAYFGMANNNIYAVDAQTGAYRWEATAKHPIWAAPLVTDDTVYVASLDHSLYAFNRADGALRWKQDLGASLAGTPALADGRLYLGTFGNKILALDAASGEQRWSADANNWVWASPTVHAGAVYVTDLSGNLLAVDAQTGRPLWTAKPGGILRGSPAIAGDAVIVGDKDGYVYARSLATGAEVWKQPAAGDNRGQLLGTPLVLPEADLILVAPFSGSNWLVAYTTAGALKWAFAPAQ